MYENVNIAQSSTPNQKLTNDVKLKHRGMPCASFSVNIIQFGIFTENLGVRIRYFKNRIYCFLVVLLSGNPQVWKFCSKYLIYQNNFWINFILVYCIYVNDLYSFVAKWTIVQQRWQKYLLKRYEKEKTIYVSLYYFSWSYTTLF